MSADNGVYILLTETEKGPEYRVAYAHAIDSIYGKFNEEKFRYDGDAEQIRSVFGKSDVFHTLNEALDKAEEIEQDYDYLEDGIAVISEFRGYDNIF
jgi:hypothetical protein